MSVGGATWDTAGTLELGSDNTFTVADATEDQPDVSLLDSAWWKFTPPATARVTLAHSDGSVVAIYTGAEYAAREDVAVDFDGDSPVFVAQASVEYHVLVGHNEFDMPETYQLTWTQEALAVSAWISTLRDRDDNQLVISSQAFELQATLNPPAFREDRDWYHLVIDSINPPGREGLYTVLETLGGPPIESMADCLFAHAVNGEQGGLGGLEEGDPCPELLGGVPAEWAANGTSGWELDCVSDPGGIADAGLAQVTMFSRGIYLRPVRDFLNPGGVLDADATADGYPDAIGIEWESPHVDLVKVEITGDYPSRPADGFGDGELIAALRDKIQPNHVGGSWTPFWLGVPGEWNEEDGHPYVRFSYRDGEPEWTEVTGVTEGDDGWADTGSYDAAGTYPPDEVAIAGCAEAWNEVMVANPSSGGVGADIALRFTLRAPRYRWIYEGLPPVTRQWPRRADGRGLSAATSSEPTPKAGRIVGGEQ